MAYEDETTPGDDPPAEKQTYDQAYFLALAAKGKDAWNAWRRDPANKDVRVTFAGIDFAEEPMDQINFSGFEFGHWVEFSGCKWRGREWEQIDKDPDAFTPGCAFFDSAAFGDCARFLGATFGSGASFASAALGNWALFNGTAFSNWARFDGATFGDWAFFNAPPSVMTQVSTALRLVIGPASTALRSEMRQDSTGLPLGITAASTALPSVLGSASEIPFSLAILILAESPKSDGPKASKARRR